MNGKQMQKENNIDWNFLYSIEQQTKTITGKLFKFKCKYNEFHLDETCFYTS